MGLGPPVEAVDYFEHLFDGILGPTISSLYTDCEKSAAEGLVEYPLLP